VPKLRGYERLRNKSLGRGQTFGFYHEWLETATCIIWGHARNSRPLKTGSQLLRTGWEDVLACIQKLLPYMQDVQTDDTTDFGWTHSSVGWLPH